MREFGRKTVVFHPSPGPGLSLRNPHPYFEELCPCLPPPVSFPPSPSQTRDPELFASVTAELGRQRDEIELIASENIVSRAVMEAQGSVMTNKYAEGYPGKRYYGGCQFVDVAEKPGH